MLGTCGSHTTNVALQVMTKEEKETLTDLKKCNFMEMNEYFKVKNEERKNMSKEEKLVRQY